jgi:3-oxoacyl-[acyl-carrier-protein] synthase II
MRSGEGSRTRAAGERVVITGMAAVTPLGNSLEQTWKGLVSGRSGIGRIAAIDPSRWPCQVAGEIRGFEPSYSIPRSKRRQMPFSSQLAVTVAEEALREAGWRPAEVDRDRVGVLLGTAGSGTVQETEEAMIWQLSNGISRMSPFQVLRVWPNMDAFFVAEAHGLRGPNAVVCTACAAAAHAIGMAALEVRRGAADVMIAGGAESPLSELAMAGYAAIRAVATSYNERPEEAMRPFDADREGFVPAQGAAILVLESLTHARARGARIHGEVLGFGASNDALHLIAPDPKGSGAALAMRRALEDAGVAPDEVDYINAHGTSTKLGDAAETRAIKSVFGEHATRVAVSSTKSMTGHMLGATGAVELAACVLAMRDGVIPPTINYRTPDPACDLDYVPNEARRAPLRVAMSNSFGIGGQNAVLVVGAVDERDY